MTGHATRTSYVPVTVTAHLAHGYATASSIATMETFQKIYRPEIYNANSPATEQYQPSLKAQDYSLTRIVYDRDERSRLAVEQGRFVEEWFIKPHRARLDQWSAAFAAA